MAMISAEVKGLWGDSIQWAIYTKNRIPHKALPERRSPIEALLDKPINRINIHPFGQRVMIYLYKEERNNDRMAPRGTEARIIGYTDTHEVYQVITTTRKQKIAKNPRPSIN